MSSDTVEKTGVSDAQEKSTSAQPVAEKGIDLKKFIPHDPKTGEILIEKSSVSETETKPDEFEEISDRFTESAGNFTKLFSLGQQLMAEIFLRQSESKQPQINDPLNSAQSWIDMWSSVIRHPERVYEAQLGLFQNYTDICLSYAKRLATGEQQEQIVTPAPGDRRFRHEAWNDSLFDFIKQTYLLTANSMTQSLHAVSQDLDPKARKRAAFFMKQFIDAMSPSNFPFTNAEVVREMIESKGENLIRGMRNLIRDTERGNGRLLVTQTDENAFQVGKNIALTPGSVVFQNELIELIQYAPAGDRVRQKPLLIFPPFINKFYILDMRQENSFVKWMVEKGFTIFVVSWKNPTAEYSDYGFDDYVTKGVKAAVDATENITGENKISCAGYCISGTLLSMTLANMKKTGDRRIDNVTYFASQSDFSDAGELGLLVDEKQIENLREMMTHRGGYMDGSEMAETFNLLRANDLIWSFTVNNYLLGRDPLPFDLLYWNADVTRMPMRLQLQYLEQCYLNNDLAKGRFKLFGEKLDLTTIDIPMYIQAATEDHIAPIRSVYRGAKLYKGEVRFMAAGSGHIAGVINPPAKNKYFYRVNDSADGNLPENFEAWNNGAEEMPGSWWNDWAEWLTARSGPTVPARKPGCGKATPIRPAPGLYVTEK